MGAARTRRENDGLGGLAAHVVAEREEISAPQLAAGASVECDERPLAHDYAALVDHVVASHGVDDVAILMLGRHEVVAEELVSPQLLAGALVEAHQRRVDADHHRAVREGLERRPHATTDVGQGLVPRPTQLVVGVPHGGLLLASLGGSTAVGEEELDLQHLLLFLLGHLRGVVALAPVGADRVAAQLERRGEERREVVEPALEHDRSVGVPLHPLVGLHPRLVGHALGGPVVARRRPAAPHEAMPQVVVSTHLVQPPVGLLSRDHTNAGGELVEKKN